MTKTTASCSKTLPFKLAMVAALVVQALPVQADPSPYTIGVSEAITHDSNIYRSQDGTPRVSGWESSTGLFGSVDQTLSRHRLRLNGEIDLDRFNDQSTLNSTAHTVSGRDDWSTIGRLSGDFGASDSSQLYRYNPNTVNISVPVTARNTQRVDQAFADFHLGTVTPLTIDLGVHGIDERYSLAAYNYLDFRRWDTTGGVSYRSTPDLTTSIGLRHTSGNYPSYGDDFTENAVVLSVFYQPSELTQLNASVSAGRQTHSLVTSPNGQTWSAYVGALWQVTGRTQLNATIVHDNDSGSSGIDQSESQFATANINAYSHTSISGGVSYDVTSKVRASLNGEWSHRDIDSQFGIDSVTNALGSDKVYTAVFAVDYMAARSTKLGCNASYAKRTTRGQVASVTYPYSDTLFGCSVRFTFN